MHELSLALALIEQIQHIARQERATRVRSVTVRVGALSGVDPEALAFCFPLAARDTPAETAQLILLKDSPHRLCLACERVFPGEPHSPCPACGSGNTCITGSDDLFLHSLEVV